jgi:class 3 adenylate cyclase
MDQTTERGSWACALDADRSDQSAGVPGVGALVAVDVVASTRRFDALGDSEFCREHQRLRGLLSAMTTTHHGTVDSDDGDGVIARFDSLTNATAAATCMTVAAPEVSSPLEEEPLRLRAGIHWGPMLVDGDGHAVGLAVEIAAQVCGAGEPGRVTMSDAAAALLEEEGWTCLERRGPAELEGVAEPLELWQVAQLAPPSGFHGGSVCTA